MADLQYHSSECETKKNSYEEYNNLDFNINVGEGRVLVKNSVRFLCNLQVRDNGGRAGGGVYFDHKCGIHAFIDSVQTSFTGGGAADMLGVKENITNYARYVAMSGIATKQPEDYTNASNLCELKGFSWETSDLLARGLNQNADTRVTTGGDNTVLADIDASMKPMCILNKMSGGNLPYSKSGNIRLTLNLAAARSALMGAGLNNAQDDYIITNPRLTFHSMPDSGQEPQVVCRAVYSVKNSIVSNFANIQAKVPSVCDSVSISFQQQAREQVAPFSNYQCEKPRGLEKIQFLFNDSTNQYITYAINDQTEMLAGFVDSFVDTGHNQVSISTFDDNQSFGVGLSFNGFIDLSNQKFGFQVESKCTNAFAYNAYMFFHSILTV